LVAQQRLDIAHKQYRGDQVYINISLQLYFTNDILRSLSTRSLQLSDNDQSSFTWTILSHGTPFFGSAAENKVWYVTVSKPLPQVEISKLEEVTFRLEEMEELGRKGEKMDEREVAALSQERNRLLDEQKKVAQEEAKAKQEELRRPSVIADQKKRAQQQLAIAEELRRLQEKNKAVEPKTQEAVKPQPPSPQSLMPQPSAQPVSFLPGAPGEGPIEQAARWVKNAGTRAQQLETWGTALTNRLGSNNSPTAQEREAFLSQEKAWRLAVKYQMNWFHEQSREEAVQGLKRLLEDPSRPGPKLDQMRSRLGGD
jgi:hypothetical protein